MERALPVIVRYSILASTLDLLVNGDHRIIEERILEVIINAMFGHPKGNHCVLGLRSEVKMSSQTIKKLLLVLIARGLLSIKLTKKLNVIIFGMEMLTHNPILLAFQDNACWKSTHVK